MKDSWIGAALSLMVALCTAGPAVAGTIFVPFPANDFGAQGDQIISYYDARDGYTTFLTVRNAGGNPDPLTVRLTFFSGGFSVPFTNDITLAVGQLKVVDVGGLRASGLASQPGVVMANAINDDDRPIVSRALTGNFTVANLTTMTGWGAPAAARNALAMPVMMVSRAAGPERPSGILLAEPPLGTVIDGVSVSLQPIQPQQLDLAAYYDPQSLAPVDQGGNQIIFISFADQLGLTYDAIAVSTPWDVEAVRNDGTLIKETTFGASGVVVTDLESVAGSGVNGAGGSIRFSANLVPGDPITRLIFFTEALGTFGTGYRLPALEPPPPPV